MTSEENRNEIAVSENKPENENIEKDDDNKSQSCHSGHESSCKSRKNSENGDIKLPEESESKQDAISGDNKDNKEEEDEVLSKKCEEVPEDMPKKSPVKGHTPSKSNSKSKSGQKTGGKKGKSTAKKENSKGKSVSKSTKKDEEEEPVKKEKKEKSAKKSKEVVNERASSLRKNRKTDPEEFLKYAELLNKKQPRKKPSNEKEKKDEENV